LLSSRFHDRPFVRLATLAALGAAVALAGCGRKGPLDPPPSAAISPPPQNEPSLGENSDPNASGFRRPPHAAAAQPAVPPAATDKRTFPLDFLIK
jgi:predicted small lipoprotein YifL